MTKAIDVLVECYAGSRADEVPRRFSVFGKWLEVREEIDRWLSPDHRYFKVHASDDGTYVLRHNVPSDIWSLSVYKKGGTHA